jgi:hypothetical protein
MKVKLGAETQVRPGDVMLVKPGEDGLKPVWGKCGSELRTLMGS